MDALDAQTPPRDFPLQAGVLQFDAKGRTRECVVLAEVPLSEVQIASDAASAVYHAQLALLGYVKDETGRVVSRLTHDWSIEGPLDTLDSARMRIAVFRRTLPLAAGRYVFSVAVQDRGSGATSVMHAPFEVQPASGGLYLGSVALLERGTPSVGEPDGDPLKVGDVSLIPWLGAFTAGSSAELPLFVPIYPRRDGGRVELTVELRRGETVVAEATPELPRTEATGRICWIGAIRAAGLQPGEYAITVTAKQAGVTARGRSRRWCSRA